MAEQKSSQTGACAPPQDGAYPPPQGGAYPPPQDGAYPPSGAYPPPQGGVVYVQPQEGFVVKISTKIRNMFDKFEFKYSLRIFVPFSALC